MYENEHVPGSPYTLKVAGAPDPSKVGYLHHPLYQLVQIQNFKMTRINF